jgi:hypothetical protein
VPAPDPVCADDDELASYRVCRSQSHSRHRAHRPRSALGVADITYLNLAEEFGYLAVIV